MMHYVVLLRSTVITCINMNRLRCPHRKLQVYETQKESAPTDVSERKTTYQNKFQLSVSPRNKSRIDKKNS